MKKLSNIFTLIFFLLISSTSFALKIIVIGAGLGGLSAAVRLSDLGHEVTILEARNREGGRVHTLYDGITENLIEAGGELIGEYHTEWATLAKRYNLDLQRIDDDLDDLADPILLDNKLISGPDSKILFEEMSKIFDSIAEESELIKNPFKPWKEEKHIRDLDKKPFSEFLDEKVKDETLRNFIELQISNDNVSKTKEQSLLGAMCQVKGGGGKAYWNGLESFVCKQGNQALAKKMAKDKNIIFNTEVTDIKTTENGVEVSALRVDTKGESSVFFGDYVVLATPPPTWDSINFVPKLNLKDYQMSTGPAAKSLCQAKPGFCGENKSACAHFSLGETWDIHPLKDGNPLGFDNLVFPECAPELIFDNTDKNINIFTGGTACFDENLLSNQFESLSVIYDKPMNNFMRAKEIAWHKEKYTKAGFSYWRCDGLKILERLNSVVVPNKLIFAGEACSPVFFGFMNGALESGKRAAQKLHKHALSVEISR